MAMHAGDHDLFPGRQLGGPLHRRFGGAAEAAADQMLRCRKSGLAPDIDQRMAGGTRLRASSGAEMAKKHGFGMPWHSSPLRMTRNQVEQSLNARHLGKAGSLRCPDVEIVGLPRRMVNPICMTAGCG
jgi:hypothetical protein